MFGTIFTFYLCEAILCGIIYTVYKMEKESNRQYEKKLEYCKETVRKLEEINKKIKDEKDPNSCTKCLYFDKQVHRCIAFNHPCPKNKTIEERNEVTYYKTAQQRLCDEVKMRNEIERRLNTTNKLIFVDEKVEEIIQTSLNDYIVKISRRYLDE